MYIHCVILGLSEKTFWKSTPRKLFALYDMYKKVNGLVSSEEENKDEFIDNILF